jgi:hypothetical protein
MGVLDNHAALEATIVDETTDDEGRTATRA